MTTRRHALRIAHDLARKHGLRLRAFRGCTIGRVRFWLARHLAPMPVPTVTEIDLDIPAPTVHHHRPGRLS